MTLLTRFAKSWFPPTLVAFGATTALLGYLYDVLYTRTPIAEDAPLQLKLQFDRDLVFAHRIESTGVMVIALGVALLLAQYVVRFLRDVKG